jgi:hypothetical protein
MPLAFKILDKMTFCPEDQHVTFACKGCGAPIAEFDNKTHLELLTATGDHSLHRQLEQLWNVHHCRRQTEDQQHEQESGKDEAP